MTDAFDGLQLWGELFEVPLMSAMFLAMVWHARRRVQALETVEALAEERASLLEQEERLLHNVSHELRTPVTIARGHLELLARRLDDDQPELDGRVRRAAADRADRRSAAAARARRAPRLRRPSAVALVPFLEDVFMRWAGGRPARLAPRRDRRRDARGRRDVAARRARCAARERRPVHRRLRARSSSPRAARRTSS